MQGMSGRLSLVLVGLSALIFSLCLMSAPGAEPEVMDMGMFFQQNCAGCHGTDASGVDADGKKLKGPSIIDEAWLKRVTDEKIVKVILKGKFFGFAMPGFKDKLSKDEAQRMVTEVIRKGKKGTPIAPQDRKAPAE